ncbi:MAG: Gar1/Naf1 family protein [Candidatus Bathyarchaeota archaeon]|nr:Gar1/Naf1 family protein [Candidatus Bathyarchaeota archaeon]MDH5791548.1 Gar1/Naf1 family protein [Candidatus Bathyarchaeota archaeon]
MKPRKLVGTVLHMSKSSGNLILEAKGAARIGETVLDAGGRRIGTVFDLFGPVSSPFLAVKPRIEDPSGLLGEALYLEKGRR